MTQRRQRPEGSRRSLAFRVIRANRSIADGWNAFTSTMISSCGAATASMTQDWRHYRASGMGRQ